MIEGKRKRTSRGDTENRYFRKQNLEALEREVSRSVVVAGKGDAMGFVDHDYSKKIIR